MICRNSSVVRFLSTVRTSANHEKRTFQQNFLRFCSIMVLFFLGFSTSFFISTFCSIFSDFYGSIEKFLVFLGFSTFLLIFPVLLRFVQFFPISMALLKNSQFFQDFLRHSSFSTFCSIFSDFYGSIEKFLVFLGFSTVLLRFVQFFPILWLY